MQHGHVLHVHVGFLLAYSTGRICMALDRIYRHVKWVLSGTLHIAF